MGMRFPLPALAVLGALASCSRPSDEVVKIRQWERTLRMELVPGPVLGKPWKGHVEISAADLPKLEGTVHFHGQLYANIDGYLRYLGDVFDNHSNLWSGAPVEWYDRMKTGTLTLEYRYTFFRSFVERLNYPDYYEGMQVLYTGVRTVTLEKP